MTPTFETERLVLRPVSLADTAMVQELFPHWEIVRFLNVKVPWPYPADGALRFYQDVALPAVERGEKHVWAICLEETPDELIGVIELSLGDDDSNRAFWLGLPWHGQGLMTEACEPVTDFWFDDLGHDRLIISKAAPNRASSRISQKQNARLVDIVDRDYVSGRWPTEIWELTREDWQARKRGA